MSNLVKTVRNLFIAGVVGISALAIGDSYFIPDSVVTVINDTQTKRYGKHDTYLVFTDDGVFKNTDAWYRLKFSSSDLQGRLMKLKGKKVEISKYGWRMPIFSSYENILEIKEVPQ